MYCITVHCCKVQMPPFLVALTGSLKISFRARFCASWHERDATWSTRIWISYNFVTKRLTCSVNPKFRLPYEIFHRYEWSLRLFRQLAVGLRAEWKTKWSWRNWSGTKAVRGGLDGEQINTSNVCTTNSSLVHSLLLSLISYISAYRLTWQSISVSLSVLGNSPICIKIPWNSI